MSGAAGEHVAGGGPRGGAGQGAPGGLGAARGGTAVLDGDGSWLPGWSGTGRGGGGSWGCCFIRKFLNYEVRVGVCLALPVPLSHGINPPPRHRPIFCGAAAALV